MSSHDEMMLLAPAYALGALDADDRRAFEEHLAGCAACAAEVRSLRPVAAGLAQTVTQVSPRPELRSRILTAVGATNVLPRVTASPMPRSGASSGPPPVARSAAAVWLPYAAVIALAATLAVYAWDQREQMRELEARLERSAVAARDSERALVEARRVAAETQAAVAVLTAPDVVRIDLKGEAVAPQASGRAMWSRRHGMVFSAANLPPLPEGRVYQVWVVTDDPNPISAGLLAADGSGLFITPPDIAPPKALAVTIEPAGGVPSPTGERYLIGAAPAI